MNRIESEDTVIVDGKRMFSNGDKHSFPAVPATTINADFLND